MRILSNAFKFLVFCCGMIWGQTNPGFENGDLTGWTDNGTGTETIDSTNARTGTYALSYDTNNLTAQRMENDSGFIIPNNSYLHAIAWVVGSNADARATISIAVTSDTTWFSTTFDTIGTTLTRLTWRRQNTGGVTDTGYIGFSSSKVANATILYWDDVVAYVSTSATTDIISPNAPSGISTSSDAAGTKVTVSWIDGTDAATGSQKAIILRADGLDQTPPALNDQAQYTVDNTIGSWIVKGIVDVGTQTFDDNTVSANTAYTYAVFMADLAYNYSSGTSSSITSLPVELTSFTAVAKRHGVELNWKTATEVNNYGFEIERREMVEGRSEMWNKIGFAEGNGTTNSPNQYSFSDKNISTGKYLYRLKQIDRDGKFEYSNTVEVTINNMPKKFLLEQNHPNPFNPSTVISYQLPVNSYITLKVYDAIGREVATLVNEVKEAGSYSVTFSAENGNANNLASGIYFARLQSGDNVQLKKMLLTK